MLERGLLPWWAHPQLKIRFFRPFPSALAYVEHRSLTGPGAVLLMHLHSLVWWVLAVLVARSLFRRWLSARVAFFATAIFALGPWHVLPLGWLANREVLLSLVFGGLGLVQHLRWRAGEGAWRALAATACFAISFTCGEYSFCFGAYVLARELVARRGDRRVVALATFLLPALAYLVIRKLGGYGTYGSAFYADPLREPGKLLGVAPVRLVTLLAEGWLTLGTDAWGTTAPRALITALVIGVGVGLILPLRRVWAALPDERREAASVFLLGSFGALVPVLAVVPAPRLLAVSALGMAPVVALVLEHAWFAQPDAARRGVPELTSVAATLLGFLHLVHGPLAGAIAADNLRTSSDAYAGTVAKLAKSLREHARTDVHVVRGAAGAFFGPFALAMYGTSPAHWRVLSQTGHVLGLRTDPASIELVAPQRDGLYPEGAGNLFRDPAHPLRVGHVVALPGMRVEVLAVNEHGPTRARFTFDHPLEADAYAFINEQFTGLRDAPLPRAGFGKPYDP